MDGFKVACIFAKVEFVRYVSNMCTIRLRLKLSCNMVGLGIEFGSYFVSLGPINTMQTSLKKYRASVSFSFV